MTSAPLYTLIETRLLELKPCDFRLLDDSAKHARHAGNNGGYHLELHIQSPKFDGLNSLACHRMILALISDLIPYPIHALSIKILR